MENRFLLISMICFLSSCRFELDKDPEMIQFVFYNSDKTVFEEVKIIAFELKNGMLTPVDSVYHYPLKSPSIPYYSNIGIGFLANDIDSLQSGFFQAIAIKKDSTVFKIPIGEIEGKATKRSFSIEMTSSGIQAQ
ncbi:hypothetical protein CLV98_104113 [Dyadobacter jejuensis]|uniref:Uncharacterized protein n=1 Tax=Dyadobacter jejuensis TaxID=1082580 RepID=A0A316AKF2_9BACT|nr:hypothetical protein [Dyadobacter jejuensis]PWJ58255.1 hypothetical protein CLV98_104113 [Dyadobacter jejuensis]